MRVAAALMTLTLVAGCANGDDFEVTLLASPYLAEDPLAGVDTLELRLTTPGRAPSLSHVARPTAATLRTGAPAVDGARLTIAALRADSVVAAGRTAPLLRAAHAATAYVGLIDRFVATPSPLPLDEARFGATATLLADGRVLIVGGATAGGPRDPYPAAISARVTLYDPPSGRFTAVAADGFAGRIFHAAVATADGGALILGGRGTFGALDSIVRFDGVSGRLVTVGTLPAPRYGAAAAALSDGSVLLVGGYRAIDNGGSFAADAALVANDTARAIALATPRAFAVATPLDDGDVLVTGGVGVDGLPLSDALVYSAAARALMPTSPSGGARAAMATPRVGHSATLVGDGSVFVFGGNDGDASLAAPERYRPDLGGFVDVGPLALLPRERHAAVALADGSVLVFGGESVPAAAATPAPLRETLRLLPALVAPMITTDLAPPSLRADAAAVRLADGSVLVLGGAVGAARTLAGGAELWVPCFADCLAVSR
jgi:hypothetical protein